MITNNQIKFVKSLHQRKFRQKYNKFIAEGDKITQEILQNSIYKIDSLFANEEWALKNKRLVNENQLIVTEVDNKSMSKISLLSTSSQVLLVLDKATESIKYPLFKQGHAIYLDDVQDPGNVGTIIRIADWFGLKSVIRSNKSADFYNSKVIQATMGSFINVGLYTSPFNELDTSSHQIVGAAMDGERLSNMVWNKNTLLVMGNEGQGISDEILQMLDRRITIPGSKNRIADSLNVAMATGIICAKGVGF